MSPTSSDSQYVVISYDITDDRRRNRVCQELKNYGEHIQFSVFECLLDEENLERLAIRLSRVIDMNEDSVRIYRLCDRCRRRITIIGTGEICEDEDVYVV